MTDKLDLKSDKKKKNKKTMVTILLDATASMGSCYKETLGGINEYLSTLKGSDADIELSLVTFNSMTGAVPVYRSEPVQHIEPLTESQYKLNGATPLYEAIEKTVKATAEAVGKKDVQTVFVIQTDGEENSSGPGYNKASTAALLKQYRDKGWEFIFFGTDMDAYSEAGSFGIGTGKTVRYDREMTRSAFSNLASNTVAYASSGVTRDLDFSAAAKASMGDSSSE